MSGDTSLSQLTHEWFKKTSQYEYSYHFKWMGLPIIQFPQDMIAIQEIVWNVRPDLIIETGIARGGSLIFYASLMEMMGLDGRVLGVDVEIREHNKAAIMKHPMFKRIHMIEGSSVDDGVVEQVKKHASNFKKTLVILDSNHTREHVSKELELYSPLVKTGSYLIVLDTVIADMPDEFSSGRDYGPSNNPKQAIHDFLQKNKRFNVDKDIENKLLITVAPGGYLQCI